MNRKSTTMGPLHPVMFFFLIYGISLFLAIFVCRTVYNTINEEGAVSSVEAKLAEAGMSAVASR